MNVVVIGASSVIAIEVGQNVKQIIVSKHAIATFIRNRHDTKEK